MKILYVTRHFNHSGYLILKRLIEEDFNIAGVLLKKEKNLLNTRFLNQLPKLLYKFICWYYRCKSLKTLNSEEILARKNNLNIYKAASIKSDEFYEQLKDIDPDIIVLGGGWHELLPERVFSYPELGCINTHPSLLPEFRGTSITRWQILHGIERSGSTIHYVNDKFDKGGILAQEACKVKSKETPQGLFYKLGKVGADIMVPLLKRFQNEGQLETYSVEHNEKYYDYFSKWTWNAKELKLDWSKSFRDIHYFIKANSQESYHYLGPIFRYKSKKYFLRESRLKSFKKRHFDFENIPDNELVVVDKKEKSVDLYRKGEKCFLSVLMVQKYDSLYKLRRAQPATKIITEPKGSVVKLS